MGTLWQDIRFGLRMLAKNPAYAAVVIIILAVGIGATTAVFSVVNAVLLRPLPYREPDRIVALRQQKKDGGAETIVGTATFVYWREHSQVFEAMAGRGLHRVYLTGVDQPRHLRVEEVSPSFFSVLGVTPLLGRGFLPQEEQAGQNQVVVLSHAFWRDQWGADANVLGRTMELDGEPYTIVGIMPPEFRFPLRDPAPFWVPLVPEKSVATMPIARLKEGVTIEQARAHMALVARQLEEIDPRRNAGYTVAVHGHLDDLLGDNRRILVLLLGAAGSVLLIACANATNLLLVHASVRQRETAVRAVLGASRGRIVRHALTESIVLSTGAGVLGILLARWAVGAVIRFCPADIPRIGENRLDLLVFAFVLGLSVLTGLFFGALPAWRAAGAPPIAALKEGPGRATTGPAWRYLRDGLVISQIAISLVLLMGAALLIRSLIALQEIDLGYEPANVLTMHIELPEAKYPQSPARRAFFESLLEGVRALPGVQSAAIVLWRGLPGYWGSVGNVFVGDHPPAGREEMSEVMNAWVGPGAFETLGIQILRGRSFTQEDTQLLAPAVIVDETLARRDFPDREPVGQQIYLGEKDMRTIVGVVSATTDFSAASPAHGVLYEPFPRSSYYATIMDVVVRAEGDPMRLADALRARVAAMDKDQACELQTLRSSLDEMLGPRRFTVMLLSIFSGAALVLASVGIYGLLQYVVTQQTHDIGIRMALGARNQDVLRATIVQGLKLTLAGLAVGLAGAFLLTRLISGLLYGVTRTDPVTFACVPLVLAGVALLASYLPARRAARIDPMTALRCE
jgi:putative ABC transport system permease protein